MSTIFFGVSELGAVAATLHRLSHSRSEEEFLELCNDLAKFSAKNAAAHQARYLEKTKPCKAKDIYASARNFTPRRIDDVLERVGRTVRLFDYNLDDFSDDESDKLLVKWLGLLLTAALDKLKAPHQLAS